MNEEEQKKLEEWIKFFYDVLKEMRTDLDDMNAKLSAMLRSFN